MKATLLVELLTEELPPKSLRLLGEAFRDRLLLRLTQYHLKLREPAGTRFFATPRRLALSIPDVESVGQDRETEVIGPPANASPQAIAGFAKKNGVAVEQLERRTTPKGEVLVARPRLKGAVLDEILAGLVEETLKALPIPKVMRWGDGDAQFVRPVHGLVMLHGARIVPGSVFGLAAGNTTRGHRFMGAPSIVLRAADGYEKQLREEGSVLADFGARRAEIDHQLGAEAQRHAADLGSYQELLDEVTALVEFPQVYVGGFDAAYLEVPQECLILTMRQNQKYFPLFDASGKLQPRFLIVSNMKVADPRHIVGGNERVVRPRLEDARFFYNQDRKLRLEERVPQLAKVVHHNKLGTQLERVQRIQRLAGSIARQLGADAALAERAAWLCKADLLTGMVGEFPELQGVMGRYYALHDGEPAAVADAIEAHYRPRFSGDAVPESPIACAVALADKLDALAGIFGIGQAPTGEKDPYGLRRQALGLLRILMERKLPLELPALIDEAGKIFPPGKISDPTAQVAAFVYERLHHMLREQGYAHDEVDAVVSQAPARIDLVPSRLAAVREFKKLPEAESLAAANKRIGNILKQADSVAADFDIALMVLPEEKTLATTFRLLRPDVDGAIRSLDYTGALKALATLKAPVDAFFDKVMVMDKDARVRANRIGFLGTLHQTMNRIADLSKLAK
ncbi:MAG TPA: glycine--tRNA ligase subunit beta [Burkholderiales bacterium]|nr:glycine--tRNA ligase subunit beta [Burkholderiales bacterium]